MVMSKVSVIMPCFNSELYLSESIESVLKQSFSNFELIIVDDCSTDKSWNIINSYMLIDSRIRAYRNRENCGVSAARNTGIKNSSGSYISFIDSDDIWYPTLLSSLFELMETSRSPFVYGGYDYGNDLSAKTRFEVPSISTSVDVLTNNPISCLSVLIDKMFFGPNKCFFSIDLSTHEDINLWLDLLDVCGHATGINKSLGFYRQVNGSASSSKISNLFHRFLFLRKTRRFNITSTVYFSFLYALNGFRKYSISRILGR